MGINPVPTIEPAVGSPLSDANSHGNRPPVAGGDSSSPDKGNSAKSELEAEQTTATSLEMPQDEVQVQRDSENDGEIVIRYLDHAGNLIVQVPSSQMLGVTRAINQDFQQEAKAREKVAATLENNEGK
jgi:hypothetical protein